ncbi:hypothetical protein J4227_05035 [Candidatus Woesearchaeota archaeon]|nr:hypothetical protein [Candidatus Woesearchaeota archaeon]
MQMDKLGMRFYPEMQGEFDRLVSEPARQIEAKRHLDYETLNCFLIAFDHTLYNQFKRLGRDPAEIRKLPHGFGLLEWWLALVERSPGYFEIGLGHISPGDFREGNGTLEYPANYPSGHFIKMRHQDIVYTRQVNSNESGPYEADTLLIARPEHDDTVLLRYAAVPFKFAKIQEHESNLVGALEINWPRKQPDLLDLGVTDVRLDYRAFRIGDNALMVTSQPLEAVSDQNLRKHVNRMAIELGLILQSIGAHLGREYTYLKPVNS